MTITEKRQGDDITLSITVGTDVSIDDLAELYVYIVSKRTGVVLIKFNKAGSTGFTALIQVTATNYKAIIPSGTTKDADASIYSIEGNIAATDAEYESSIENAITLDDQIKLLASTSKASSSG